MTVVAKLGSSIVADDDGALRSAVLDSVCAQVAELHHGGENVVLVTSGAIARGMRLLELDAAPERDRRDAGGLGGGPGFAVPRLRGAARRGQDVHAAQVLLTSFDMSARMHYLNARQTLRRLLDWRAVPVVNENDTTATDEITFGDNDFLSAQVAILLEARLLVLLTDTAGLHTADPRTSAERRAGRGGEVVRGARALRDRRPDLGVRLGRHAEQGGGGGDGERGRDPGRGLRRDRRPGASRPPPAASGSAPGSRRTRSAPRASSCGSATRSRAGEGSWSTTARRGCCASAAPACSRSGSPSVEGEFAAGDAVEVVCDGEVVGKGIVNYSAAELGRIRGLKSAQVLEQMPNASEEAVHRDYFVLT